MPRHVRSKLQRVGEALKLAKKEISNFEKTNLWNFTNPADNAEEKTKGEVKDAANEGGRQRLQFYEDQVFFYFLFFIFLNRKNRFSLIYQTPEGKYSE
jgi:hypothetical protein